MRVLLADDSSLILERLQELVSNYKQIEVVGAFKNGTETLNAIKAMKPDLAIVDIKMPGLSGLYILKEIRKMNITTIFITLTLYSSDYYRQLAIQAGTNYFFSKAEDFETLTQVLAELLEKEKNHKENSISIS